MSKQMFYRLASVALLIGLSRPHPISGVSATPATPPPLSPVAYLPLIAKSAGYVLQNGSPAYLTNYVNTAACNWMGIVGQAFGLDGKPQINLTVHLEGGGLNVDSITGSQPAIGPGAYQIELGSYPITTTNTYQLQLRNVSGQVLSEFYTIPTYGQCNMNLILVNFTQVQ